MCESSRVSAGLDMGGVLLFVAGVGLVVLWPMIFNMVVKLVVVRQ
jgi:hypothetical protein